MNDSKIKTTSSFFENKEIRSLWDKEKEEYYFSVLDVICDLTNSNTLKDICRI